MTSSCVPEVPIQKDAEKMITATKKALIMKATHAQDTVHSIVPKKNSDAPSQTIQSQAAPFLHCAFQKRKTITAMIAIINNAHSFATLQPNNNALDTKITLDAKPQIPAYQPVLKPVLSNVAKTKLNAKAKLIATAIALILMFARQKPRMSMVTLAPMILPLMDAQSIAVMIPSCAHPQKMLLVA